MSKKDTSVAFWANRPFDPRWKNGKYPGRDEMARMTLPEIWAFLKEVGLDKKLDEIAAEVAAEDVARRQWKGIQ